MNRVIILFKDGTMHTYEGVQPFQNNIGELLFEHIENVQYFFIQAGTYIRLHTGSDMLHEIKEKQILEDVTSFGFTDDEDMVKYDILVYDIFKQYFKLQNLI